MVIETVDAPVTDIAMAGILGPQHLASGTEVAGVKVPVKFQEGDLGGLSYVSWVLVGSDHEEDVGDNEEDAEGRLKIVLSQEWQNEDIQEGE